MPQQTAEESLEKFRKFSTLHMIYLRYIGLWSLDSNSSVFSKCLYYVYNKLIITIMFVFTITLLADICLSLDDLSIVTDDGCFFAGIFVVMFKVMTFQIRHEKIARQFDETIESCRQLCMFPNTKQRSLLLAELSTEANQMRHRRIRFGPSGAGSKNCERCAAGLEVGCERVILDRYLLFCRAIFYGFNMLGFFLAIALLFLVPVENGSLPVRARYPFDTTVSPWHEVAYLVEFCSISFGLTAIIGIDNLINNLCILFLVQLEILNAHFRHCGARRGDAPGDFAVQLGRSVRCHRRLLAVIDDYNGIYSVCMFVQMLASTTIICLTGFQATLIAGKATNVYKFSIYLLAGFTQLFYICWLGNEVTNKSASLTQSQWFSDWSDQLSVKTGRLLILSMIFAKRTLNLRAGVFYVMSMETFVAILRGSYSFFALLNTMHSAVDQ